MRLLTGAVLMLAILTPIQAAAQRTQPRPVPARAKPTEKAADGVHSFSLEPQAAFFQVKDEALARLRHQGFLPGIALRYIYAAEQWKHGGALGFLYGGLSSTYDTPADAAQIRWAYDGAYRVFRDAAWEIFAGGQVRGNYDLHFYPRVDESHAYWLTAYDLRAKGHAVYTWTRRTRFEAELAIPLAGLVSRPPYPRYYNNDIPDLGPILSRIHEDLGFATVPDYFSAELNLRYRFVVTSSIAQSITYQFNYTRFAEPRTIQTLSHAMLFGLHFAPWGGF